MIEALGIPHEDRSEITIFYCFLPWGIDFSVAVSDRYAAGHSAWVTGDSDIHH